ncbi:MAG: hypothetical protein KAT17_05210, partial [Candidatus Aminicenantes bacterium]|nr:hypothetical protein [Candidatus Aminicenantes bacterium]
IPNEKLMLSPGMKAIFRIKTEIKPEPPAREEIKKAKQTQQKKVRTKKIDFEVSAGISHSDPGDFYYRASGIDTLVDQYIKNYGLEYSVSGEFGKNIFYFPLNATMNYQVSSKLYLKGGLEFGYGNQSNEKTYTLNWGSFSEDSRYKLASTLMYFMPFFGAETRFGDFGIYANVCFNFMSLSHQKNIELSEPTYWYKKNDDISASGSGFGILLGGKYTFELGKKLNLLVKLEFCYLKIGKLTGTRDTAISNSAGESFFESVDGTIYSFEMNPYDMGWFNSWELYDSIPTDSWIRNINELTFNLSSIRLMVGFVF